MKTLDLGRDNWGRWSGEDRREWGEWGGREGEKEWEEEWRGQYLRTIYTIIIFFLHLDFGPQQIL